MAGSQVSSLTAAWANRSWFARHAVQSHTSPLQTVAPRMGTSLSSEIVSSASLCHRRLCHHTHLCQLWTLRSDGPFHFWFNASFFRGDLLLALQLQWRARSVDERRNNTGRGLRERRNGQTYIGLMASYQVLLGLEVVSGVLSLVGPGPL